MTLSFISSLTAPDAGFFYLTQTDASGDIVYYWSTQTVAQHAVLDAAAPEPASLVLLGTGLLAAAGLGVRRRKQ